MRKTTLSSMYCRGSSGNLPYAIIPGSVMNLYYVYRKDYNPCPWEEKYHIEQYEYYKTAGKVVQEDDMVYVVGPFPQRHPAKAGVSTMYEMYRYDPDWTLRYFPGGFIAKHDKSHTINLYVAGTVAGDILRMCRYHMFETYRITIN